MQPTAFRVSTAYAHYVAWSRLLVQGVLPFAVLVVFNRRIYRDVRERRRRWEGPAALPRRRQRRMQNGRRRQVCNTASSIRAISLNADWRTVWRCSLLAWRASCWRATRPAWRSACTRSPRWSRRWPAPASAGRPFPPGSGSPPRSASCSSSSTAPSDFSSTPSSTRSCGRPRSRPSYAASYDGGATCDGTRAAGTCRYQSNIHLRWGRHIQLSVLPEAPVRGRHGQQQPPDRIKTT